MKRHELKELSEKLSDLKDELNPESSNEDFTFWMDLNDVIQKINFRAMEML